MDVFGKPKFEAELKDLGYEVSDKGDNRLSISLKIDKGRAGGKTLQVGFEVPPDFPVNPPSGPHISPKILDINPGGSDHKTRAHESPNFGSDWQYLSRPFPAAEWPRQRSVKQYLKHVDQLLNTL